MSAIGEKGVKDSRIQGAKGSFSNDLKPLFSLLIPILYSDLLYT